MTRSASSQNRPTSDESPRQNVLVLAMITPFPPANAGDAVYSRGVIQSLAPYLNLTVLCADGGGAPQNKHFIDWRVKGSQRRGQASSVVSRWPLQAWKGATPDFHAELDRLLQRDWSAIILDNLGTVHALPKLLSYRRIHPDTKLVYVSYEYEYETRRSKYGAYSMGMAKRVAAALDLRKVGRSEARLLRETDIVTVINRNDLLPFRRIAPDQRYFTLTPGYDGPVSVARTIDAEVPRRVLLLGGRKSQQKRQILLDWMRAGYGPLSEAGIEIVIAGDMDDDLRAELQRNWPLARVLGFVDDLDALIRSARIGLIADTMGGGFKLRLLSHVFQRLPIVGLDYAVDGLPTAEGRGYLGAENLTALVRLVVDVIDDTARLDALQKAAFDDCSARFSWATRGEQLARVLTAPHHATADLLLDNQTEVGTEP
ncbi:MAG: hypothetical protein U1A24_03710 [Cypionkella sp.]|uniref:hypothetical protein n=1 Tax=Cypionkella sp. TaxID=2811411 RepID=UPI002AB9C827|nr:hypothetical protein [Cypionkella sp.]MDZ4309650.1 hypothetical protein [Cypionkella sp.]